VNQDQVLSIIRYILTAVGTVAVTKGLADEGTITAIVGGLIAAASLIWSMVAHKAAPPVA
jgi:drug/metabolite transporter superfamily protein YnfA